MSDQNHQNNFPEMKKVTFAIFGLGRAGTIHFGNLIRNQRAVIRYIVEENRARAEQVLQELQFDIVSKECQLVTAAEADKVYQDKSVDAVIVCTHTDSHKEIVQSSLQAGKSVFCEKPVATELSDTKACYDLAEKNGQFLFCAFNRRQDPSIRELHKRVRRGDLGQIQSIKTCSRDSPIPTKEYLKISGGIFHDCAVHDIDVVCWILGEFPDVVYTQAHAFHKNVAELGDVDQVNITMKFASGIIATIDLNREASYGYDQRIEVFGSNGMLETRNNSKINLVGHLGKNGASSDPVPFSFPQRYADAYREELDYFIDYVLGLDKHVEVTRTDTIMATIIAETCMMSYHKGIPIKLKDVM
ncbi:myo-inositol 2-dehydrogenase-like [Asterias rubens]|uniref:myo-inositol 2-dehydrogenase-like n=1 Tax=Asterias rubens TaxID=7604 RepID=UPI0014550EC5|nr:myo-inositol 2-dehydrogenase-like [Asterias rubens]